MTNRVSVFQAFVSKISWQAKRVIIGYPSSDGSKASGLHYSAEYYAKQSGSLSRSDSERLVAQIANTVLTSQKLHDFISEMVDEITNEMAVDGYAKSGLKDEDAAQEKAAEKVVTPKPRKTVARKSTSKTPAKVPAKRTATKAAK